MAVPHALRNGFILAVITAIIFGLYPAAFRFVYQDGGNAAFMVMATAVTRALSMSFYCLARRIPLFAASDDRRQAVTGGIFQFISNIGLLSALAYLPGPLVLIIVFTHTIMLLFFLAWKGEAKLNASTVVTTIAALGGLTVVLDIWSLHGGTNWLGIALAFSAALATAGRLYAYGHQTKTHNAIAVGAENFLVTAALCIAIPFFQTPHLPASFAGWMYALLGCASLSLGSFGMFTGISWIGSFRWSLFSKIEPVFTSLFSILLLGELLKFSQYLGMVVVITSLAAYQIMQKKEAV